MKYRDLGIQTQREAPNNARTPGQAFLARAAYVTREGALLPLGERSVARLKRLAETDSAAFFERLSLPVLSAPEASFFSIASGSTAIVHCPACGYSARRELARFRKPAPPGADPLPLEKVHTPGCSTIESLAEFLQISREQTAKAMMFTRPSDGQFVFVVIRGDMTLSEAKLARAVGETRLAAPAEIEAAGAAAGYASPVGLRGALIVVDDLIPGSANLVAGANESGYHLRNTNAGRDFQPDLITDLAMAGEGDACPECGGPLAALNAEVLAEGGAIDFVEVLSALAETHHDDQGLTLPAPAAPFEVYLMHLAGKQLDTRLRAEEMCTALEAAGLSALFDDRDERAGVKFNDADLIGLPVRVTVGEKNLVNGMVEIKARTAGENQFVPVEALAETIRAQFTA